MGGHWQRYTFQLYFDFSAYSRYGDRPWQNARLRFSGELQLSIYFSSITEFWRRWHISLGTWFRDYVYIPLGGNRVQSRKHDEQHSCRMDARLGIWHGASWNFVAWGVYYGILLLLEKFVFGRWLEKLPAVFRHIYCMFFVMLGWNLFVFEDFGSGVAYLKALFGLYGQGLGDRETIYLLYNNAVLLVLLILGSTHIPAWLGGWICRKLEDRELVRTTLRNLFYVGIFLLSVAFLVDASYNPFLYFRF